MYIHINLKITNFLNDIVKINSNLKRYRNLKQDITSQCAAARNNINTSHLRRHYFRRTLRFYQERTTVWTTARAIINRKIISLQARHLGKERIIRQELLRQRKNRN